MLFVVLVFPKSLFPFKTCFVLLFSFVQPYLVVPVPYITVDDTDAMAFKYADGLLEFTAAVSFTRWVHSSVLRRAELECMNRWGKKGLRLRLSKKPAGWGHRFDSFCQLWTWKSDLTGNIVSLTFSKRIVQNGILKAKRAEPGALQ